MPGYYWKHIYWSYICELHYVSLCDIDETDQGRTQLEGQCAATLKDHSATLCYLCGELDMEPYHFCGNEDDHNKRSNESHIISLGKPHSPSELDQNDTIPFQPQSCSSQNTLASDLESHSHILFPTADYVGVRVKINSTVTNGLRQIMVLVHLHYDLDL